MATARENWSYRKFKKALDEQYNQALNNLTVDGVNSSRWIRPDAVNTTYNEVWPAISFFAAGDVLTSTLGFNTLNRDAWQIGTERYLREYGGNRVTEVWAESRKLYEQAVREATEQALTEGLGTEATQRRIRKLVNGKLKGDINVWRARRIARTETIAAGNYGTWMGQREAVNNGAMIKKKWQTRIDGNERPEHLAADGQEREVSEPFEVAGELLMFPGDPRGSAGNVINCRCVSTATATIDTNVIL